MEPLSNPEPILVIYKYAGCGFCIKLANKWDQIKTKLQEIYPKLRFFEITVKDSKGGFDENIIPKDIYKYSHWYPIIFLVPGNVWDDAMANLGPSNPVKIKDGVQVMNGIWKSNNLRPRDQKYDLVHSSKYNIENPEEFGNWLKEALNNEDFKRVSNESRTTSTKPIMSNIVRSSSSTGKSIGTVSSSRPFSMISSSKKEEPVLRRHDVCRMRLVSRPR